jgi:hypothetical protein
MNLLLCETSPLQGLSEVWRGKDCLIAIFDQLTDPLRGHPIGGRRQSSQKGVWGSKSP